MDFNSVSPVNFMFQLGSGVFRTGFKDIFSGFTPEYADKKEFINTPCWFFPNPTGYPSIFCTRLIELLFCASRFAIIFRASLNFSKFDLPDPLELLKAV